MTIKVVPKITQEPPFTPGESNTICWTNCNALRQELFQFPATGSGKSSGSPQRLATFTDQQCHVVENLTDGIRYGYFVEATIFNNDRFVTLHSDTTYSTQDNLPPPAVTVEQFTVSADGEVTIQWPHQPDELGYIEKYILFRRNKTVQAYTAIDTLPFFPVSDISPKNYFPVLLEARESLYLDGDLKFVFLPQEIKRSALLKTSIKDRWREQENFLTFRLNASSFIYIALDKRFKSKPEWLARNFILFRRNLRTSRGQMELYKSRNVFAAGEVTLGGNFAVGASIINAVPDMYAVFVKPVEELFPFAQGESIQYTDTLGEVHDLETFHYKIHAADAAGNTSEGSDSSPIILDLHGKCKPIITDWFVFENDRGQRFARGVKNTIRVQNPKSQIECLGFRSTDSLRFQAVRENTELFGIHQKQDEQVNVFDSGWLSLSDLPESFSYEFDLLPPAKDPNFVSGVKYYYRAAGKDRFGNISIWSDTVSAIQDFFPPSDIHNLTARPRIFDGGEDGCVDLSWLPAFDEVSGLSSYIVYRSGDGGASFSAVDTISGAETSYCDALSAIGVNQIFHYKISAMDRVGNARSLVDSDQEVAIRALVGPRIFPDSSNTLFCSSDILGINRDTLSFAWPGFNSENVQGYEIEIVNPDGSQNRKLISAPVNQTFDCPIDGGDGIYRLRMRAFYVNGDSTIFSNTITFRKKASLAGVQNLTAVHESAPTGDILLSWTHPDSLEIVEYRIFTWPQGAPQPETPAAVLPGDSLQWRHEFEKHSLRAYECNNYLVQARDCFNLISLVNPIVGQFSNRAPEFTKDQTEIDQNNIKVFWNRPSPRLPGTDDFYVEMLVFKDVTDSAPVQVDTLFNKTDYTLFNAFSGHNYYFQVREILLGDTGQGCAEQFISHPAPFLVVPLDNLPEPVAFDVQALPVPPGTASGDIFLSWQGYSEEAVNTFLVQWSEKGSKMILDSTKVVDVDTLLIRGFDISKIYSFTVTAIDFLQQRSNTITVQDAHFKPFWVFTPKLLEVKPSCFRDSLELVWSWVDENLSIVADNFGADSLVIELSIDPDFNFNKSTKKLGFSRRHTFHWMPDFPFASVQNEVVYARIRAQDRWQHLSPWSTDYPQLGAISGHYDALPPAIVTSMVDSTAAPDFGAPGEVNVHLSWIAVDDNCSGTWYYEITRDEEVLARDSSRADVYKFVDRRVKINDNFLNLQWQVHAVDSLMNRQTLAKAGSVPFMISPPDSGWCLDDTTFCWSSGQSTAPASEMVYFLEGARFVELFGSPITNVFIGPLTDQCTNFKVPWEGIYWRIKTRVNSFDSAWSDLFFCQLNTGTNVTEVESNEAANIPEQFALKQNYPNPFNPTTTIKYAIPAVSSGTVKVEIEIFNLTGQKIRTLVQDEKPAGEHRVVWDGRDDRGTVVGNGLYVYRMRVKDFVSSQRMLLLK
ncbi:MAG: FlgD immunoglobulin-like domain containing protein [bacterium]